VNELALDPMEVGRLRPATRQNLERVLKYRSPDLIEEIGRKAQDHIDLILAKPVLMRTLLDDLERVAKKDREPSTMHEFNRKRARFYRDQSRAGQIHPGETKTALQAAKGALGRPRRSRAFDEPKSPRFTFSDIYGQHTS